MNGSQFIELADQLSAIGITLTELQLDMSFGPLLSTNYTMHLETKSQSSLYELLNPWPLGERGYGHPSVDLEFLPMSVTLRRHVGGAVSKVNYTLKLSGECFLSTESSRL